MPRIYDPQLQTGGGYLQSSNNTGLQTLGAVVSGLAEKMSDQRFAIEAAEIDAERIRAVEQMQQSARHDTASGQDYVGDTAIEGGLADFAVNAFNEKTAEFVKRHGERGELWAAQKRNELLSQTLNIQSTARAVANSDYYSKYVETLKNSVSNGTSDLESAVANSAFMLESLQMPPQMRQSVTEYSRDHLTLGQFEFDMKADPSIAINKLKKNEYQSASPKMQDYFGESVDRYIKGEAQKETQAALEAATYGFRHVPNSKVVSLAKERGLNDVAQLTVTAQKQAAFIDAVTSGSIPNANATVEGLRQKALASNDPESMRLYTSASVALANKTKMVQMEPRSALIQEGIPTNDDDYSDPASLVENRRDIRQKVIDKFNIEPAFLGESARVIEQIVKQSPASDRAGIITSLAANMTDREKAKSTVELRDVNPRLGVVMTLPPTKQQLGNQILSEPDPAYMPTDKKFMPPLLTWDEGVEWGDVNAKNAVFDSAKAAYAYRAKMKNVNSEAVDEDIFKEVMNDIAGKPIRFGAGKTVNFYTSQGDFADEYKAQNALEYAFETGDMPDVYDSKGNPLNTKALINNGVLVPTGENGKYNVVRYGMGVKEYYQNEDGTKYTVDMLGVYNKYGNTAKASPTMWQSIQDFVK